MIAWPHDDRQYDRVCTRVDELIDRACRFPHNVFRKRLPLRDVFDFYSIFAEGFYARVAGMARLLGESSAYLLVIEPDPVKYFHKHFAKYPLMVIETKMDLSDDYYRALNQDPGDSIADAINTNANAIAIVFERVDLVIYGERESEIAMCASVAHQPGAVDTMQLLERVGQLNDEDRAKLIANYKGNLTVGSAPECKAM